MAWTLYYYTPSSAAAGIFVALFGFSTVYHFYQLLRARTWFMIPFIIGGILETTGYVGRLLSAREAPNYTTGSYAMQSALTLIAPAFFAASIYMELGRIIRMLHEEKLSVVPPRWLTNIFVAGDVLSFLMQASGAGIMIQNSTNPTTGQNVIVGGLFVQVIFFGFFMITSFIFQIRISRNPSQASLEPSRQWHRHMYSLYITSILIFVRSVVRVAEYLEGYTGYLLTHEAFIYVFDALPMLAVMVCMHYFHPSEINCLLDRGKVYFDKGYRVVRRPFAEQGVEMESATLKA